MQRLLLSLLALVVATGTDTLAADLQLTEVRPTWGVESLPTEIEVHGVNFTAETELAVVGGGAYYVSSVDTGGQGTIGDVAVVGNRAYGVGADFTVFDIEEPSSPIMISVLPGVSGESLAIADNFAYVMERGELKVVDVADPLRPQLLNSVDACGEWAWHARVDVAGQYAVAACGSLGSLTIFDVADPSRPRAVGHLDSLGAEVGGLWNVQIQNGVAFVAVSNAGLAAVDISDPSKPSVLSTGEPGTAGGKDLEVIGNQAYVTGNNYGVQIFDVHDPSSILLVGGAAPARNAIGIGVSDGFAYVSDTASAAVYVYDVARSHSPAIAYTVWPQDIYSFATNIEVADGFAYAANIWTGSLDIYDVRETTMPDIAGLINTGGRVSDVVANDDKLYVAADYAGLQIYDIAEPSQSELLGATDGVVASNLELVEDLVYLLDRRFGLRIFDVRIPDSPEEVGSLAIPENLRTIAVSEPFVYLTQYMYIDDVLIWNLLVVDVTDVREPRLISTLSQQDGIAIRTITDEYLYLFDYRDGLLIMDLTDPARPVRVGSLDTPGFAYAVAVAGDLAFIADGPHGFHIADVSEASSPQIIGSLQRGMEFWSVSLSGTTAFTEAGVGEPHDFRGMLMIDVNQPMSPRLVGGSNHIVGQCGTLYVSGSLGYVASCEEGVRIFWLPPAGQDTSVLGPEELVHWLPPGMNPGVYDTLGVNADGQFDILRNAFTILPDGDGDGVPTDEDCDDQNADIYPGAADLPGNAVDEDCDGTLSCDPAADWKNRGEFTSCVARECGVLARVGLVSGQDCGELVSEARRPATGQD